LLTWENYLSPESLDQFRRETGIRVDYCVYENIDEMMGLLKANPGAYDVIIAGSEDLADLQRLSAIEELDRQRLKGLEQLDPRVSELSTDPAHRYLFPYMWGTFAIGYLPERTAPPEEESLSFVFDEAHQGTVLMIDNMKEVLMLANAQDGREMNETSSAALAEAETALREMAGMNKVSYRTDQEIIDELIAGTCAVAVTYSGDIAYAARENPELRYFLPKEGAPVWIDTVYLSRHAPNQKGAYEFMNFLLRPDVIAGLSNYTRYPNGNQAGMELVDAELRTDPVLVPRQALEKARPYPVFEGTPSAQLAEMNQRIRNGD